MHAFQDPVGISLQEAAVHVGPGIALVGVADDVFHGVGLFPGLVPLQGGGEPGAAAAPQAGGLDFGDDSLRAVFSQGLEKGGIPADREVVVDRGRVDEGVVAEDLPLLLGVEGDVLFVFGQFARGRIPEKEGRHRLLFPDGFGDDGPGVLRVDFLVEQVVGLNDDVRFGLAVPVAPGDPDGHLLVELGFLERGPEGVDDLDGAAGPAAGARRNDQDGLLVVFAEPLPGGDRQFWNVERFIWGTLMAGPSFTSSLDDGRDPADRRVGVIVTVDDDDGTDGAAAETGDGFEAEFRSAVVSPAPMPSCFSNSVRIFGPPLTWQAVPRQTVATCLPRGLRLKAR